jgi:chromosome segregation ATPase
MELQTQLTEIETQITQLQTEASQLSKLETELAPQLGDNQAALIAGDAEAVASASGVAARLDAVTARREQLATQLQALDERAAPLRATLQRVANEARLREELRALATASTQTFCELESERARVDAFLSEASPRLSEARRLLSGQRAQFLGIVSQLAPAVSVSHNPRMAPQSFHPKGYNGLEEEFNVLLQILAQLEAEGADLSAVRSDFQSSYATRSFDRQTAFAPRKHEKALNAIEGIV